MAMSMIKEKGLPHKL